MNNKQLKMLMFTYKLSLNISSSLWCYRLENASVLIFVSVYNCSHRHNNNLNTSSRRWKSSCAMSPCAPLIHIQSSSRDPLCTVTTATAWCFMCFFSRLPAFYPEAAYMLCECALHKTNRDETIRERGCFTVSFRHILDLMFIRILTTSLFDRRQRICGGQRWIH